MKNLVILIGFVASFFFLASCSGPEVEQVQRNGKNILIVADTAILNSSEYQSLLQKIKLGEGTSQMNILTSSDPADIVEDSLESVSAILIWGMDVSGLSVRPMADLERYIQMGGGFVAIDCRMGKPLSWPFWEEINHTRESAQTIATPVADVVGQQESSSTPTPWNIQLFDNASSIDWPAVLNQAIGNNIFSPALATSQRAPEDSRFTIKVLDSVMIEPMELTVLPDNRVLFIERRGKMKLFLPETGKTKVLHEFDVCTSGNYEDGLLGLTVDPNFQENHYIYLYYSPGSECEKAQYLSRFTMIGDSLNLLSEKVVIQVPVQRKSCCHSGGSLNWDAQGNLYLSTGDNTSSKESDGYSPLDERPGRGPYDSQKSSGNTNDLRGKILRITPNIYGGYDIPEGNLFPPGDSLRRPEIYVMGARNPFRIAIDQKTGYVYWGDVGPDVGAPGKYGPESYDEWNQARSPGYYGWPYFVGNNLAYRSRDFDVDTVGDFYDAAIPVNMSPNNTGAIELPPARPAYIWYPKGPSENFPQLGVGSNSAMAGPIYYSDLFPDSSTVKFPEYFDGKWFIYEWARSWIQVVTFDEEGDLARIEPFLPEWEISKPIDMEFGPDGAMYLLEYGANYFADNPDARLVRIEYAADNREPIAMAAANKSAGAVALEVDFTSAGSFDYDEGDSLSFSWSFGDGETATGPTVNHTFDSTGIYTVTLTVRDTSGATGTDELKVAVGNAIPDVQIAWQGNRSFLLNSGISYAATVVDPEDQQSGALRQTAIDLRSVYLPSLSLLDNMSVDEALAQGNFTFQKGKELIESSDCASCHALALSSVGPSYYQIADRYRNEYDMVGYLANKIITGGNGNWGGKIMAGHPQLNIDQTTDMVRYILSLEEGKQYGQLPPSGRFALQDHLASPGGAYLVRASYTDQGAGEIPAQTGAELLILRDPVVQAEANDTNQGMYNMVVGPNRDIDVIAGLRQGNWFAFDNWDLTGIEAIEVSLAPGRGGVLSVRTGSPDGEEIGKVRLPNLGRDFTIRQYRIPISSSETNTTVYFVAGDDQTELGPIDRLRVIGGRTR